MPLENSPPVILWLRRDLRLSDHPGWAAALAYGAPVIPVFVLDPFIEQTYGAAPKWRLGESLADLQRSLEQRGSKLVLRRGDALDCLQALIAETSAQAVVWSRQYEPAAIARDTKIKSALQTADIEARSVNASLLFEPWEAATKTGGPFKVYSPFWREVGERDVPAPLAAPSDLAPPDAWPDSDDLGDWQLGRAMNRGAEVLAQYACVGEDAAADRLASFVEDKITLYGQRDFPDRDVCSRLSEHLTDGEISPRQIWFHAQAARPGAAKPALKFLKEVVWREFAYHLMYHSPALLTGNWRAEWDSFPWRDDNDQAERWRRGQTGIDMVDAAMREMYTTGTMHNRARMLTASFLTKHLCTHWRVGERWFADCLIDWDPAANAMGWQWTAGSGPDAAPYFRVFNPDLQAEKFDPKGAYRDRFLPWRGDTVSRDASNYYQAIPRSWGMDVNEKRPSPVISLKEGRERALAAYQDHKQARDREQDTE